LRVRTLRFPEDVVYNTAACRNANFLSSSE
jgi:hypothetical protein